MPRGRGNRDRGRHAVGIRHRPFERLHAAHRAAGDRQQPRNAQVVDQLGLQQHHVADGDHRKRQPVRAAGLRIHRRGPGGALATAQHIGANDEILLGIERFARTDHVVPPAGFAGFGADTGGVRVA